MIPCPRPEEYDFIVIISIFSILLFPITAVVNLVSRGLVYLYVSS